MNYEQEEEFLTNDLSRKLAQVQLTTKTFHHLNTLMPRPQAVGPGEPLKISLRLLGVSSLAGSFPVNKQTPSYKDRVR